MIRVADMTMRWLLPVLCLSLVGCRGLLQDAPLPPSSMPAMSQAPAMASAGAIYAAGSDLRLFEDVRARRVGDLLTIVLQESTSASKSASTKTQKDSEVDLQAPTLLGRGVTANGTPLLQNSIGAEREFEGAGSSSQSNRLTGNITVAVVQRMPNGNLVVQGEKWLKLNQGDEFVRISGIVRPFDIGQDNTVSSDRVADARISYGGRGVVASSNRAGWLDRFFNSGLMPY